MIYLNFTNLDNETQQHLITVSKKDIEQKFGLDLKRYAKRNNVDYQSLLEHFKMRFPIFLKSFI